MKLRTIKKKLELSKRTVADLSNGEMNGVHGGLATRNFNCPTDMSFCCYTHLTMCCPPDSAMETCYTCVSCYSCNTCETCYVC
ncbi:MAG: hypothetical protein QG657_1698 [Acidobacteriota bacterium]|nr:hypothetical protein [Acidobacteriota bacterium]